MDRVELLTVKDTFWLGPTGAMMLILHPDFSVPKGGWKNVAEKVVIVRPDGREIEVTAEITLQHFNIRDPNVPIDKRWRVGLYLTDAKEDDAPIGSKILVSRAVRDAIHHYRSIMKTICAVLICIEFLIAGCSTSSPKVARGHQSISATTATVEDAQLLFEMGKYDEAEYELQKVLQIEPENRKARYYLTLVHQGQAARQAEPKTRGYYQTYPQQPIYR